MTTYDHLGCYVKVVMEREVGAPAGYFDQVGHLRWCQEIRVTFLVALRDLPADLRELVWSTL